MVKRLLILNGLATLGVVLNHAGGWGFIAMFWWTDRYQAVSVPNFAQMGSVTYYSLRLIEQSIAFTIPAFLFVSGFFAAFLIGKEKYLSGLKIAGRRITALAIPYLIWSGVMLVFLYLLGSQFTLSRVLKLLVVGGAAEPYYFTPLIIQLFILAPWLVAIGLQNWKGLLFGAAALQLFVQALRYPWLLGAQSPTLDWLLAFTPGWFFPSRVFWFVLGIVVGLHLGAFKQWIINHRGGLVLGLIVMLPVGMIEWELLLRFSNAEWIPPVDTVLDSLYAIFFIFSFIAFETLKIPRSPWLADLGSKSYGIYLVHIIILTILAKMIYRLAPALLGIQWFYQLVLVVLGLGIPLVMMAIVKKSPVRKFYRTIFG